MYEAPKAAVVLFEAKAIISESKCLDPKEGLNPTTEPSPQH